MAVQTFNIQLQWENGNAFQMTTKKNSDDLITDIKIEENGHMVEVWSPAQAYCITRINAILTVIGEEMKVP
jgi:hypothetical protein